MYSLVVEHDAWKYGRNGKDKGQAAKLDGMIQI